MDKHENFMYFLIGMISTLSFCWLVGLFITLNPLWIYDSTVGRIIGSLIFIIVLIANIKYFYTINNN